MFSYLRNDISKNLVVKYVGLKVFSLLGSYSSSSSVDASSFGCVVILSLYLTLNFVISSLMIENICDGKCELYVTKFYELRSNFQIICYFVRQ
jgi:hypothetical protein